jgi:acetyltransferase-like isoleucine patch superfamily enzyme
VNTYLIARRLTFPLKFIVNDGLFLMQKWIQGWNSDKLSIGKYTYMINIHKTFNIGKGGKVTIGRFCAIAAGVKINSDANPHLNLITTYPLRTKILNNDGGRHDSISSDETRIGNDVWIGLNSIILSGVKIGDGTVIAAGAVVTHDIPPYAVAAGVPAKVSSYRFDQKQISKLLKIAWWNWDINKIKANSDLFYGPPENFINKFYAEIEDK